jgi:hypothetical protein
VTTPNLRLSRDDAAAGGSFVLGGSLFAIGALLAQAGADLTTVCVTYLVGGFFFSLGGWLSIVITGAPSFARRSAMVLFVGTLFFAVSLVAAFASGFTPRQSDSWVWLPDIVGCICFLASGHLAMLDVGGGRVVVRPHDVAWWIVVVNQVGSVLFFLAGVAAFVRPATDESINVGLVNWGTFAGALCFAVAGFIQLGGGLADLRRARIVG